MNLVPMLFASMTSFGVHLREVVTALLSCGIVGAAIYEVLFTPRTDTQLAGWAGMIVGVYFGHTVSERPKAGAGESKTKGGVE